MKRPATGGKGLDGVAKHEPDYYNPASDVLDAAPPKIAATLQELPDQALAKRSTLEELRRS